MSRRINLFDGTGTISDGLTAGVSKPWYGEGDVELVTLDNVSGAAVIMERREHNVNGAPWVNAGGLSRDSIQRWNFFASGYEYRAKLIENSGASAVRLTLRKIDNTLRRSGITREAVVKAFSSGNIVGFANAEAKGIIEYGDLDALKAATAWIFFCFDATLSAENQATFHGAWEKSGVDYRKLHVNGSQYLLSTAIAGFVEGGGSGEPGVETPNAGEVGGSPLVRTGSATLTAPPDNDNSVFAVYSPTTGELLWSDPVDATEADFYEVALNGTVIYVGQANAYGLPNLTADTVYTASIVRFREDGTYSAPLTLTAATPESGTGGVEPPAAADGTSTVYDFSTPTDGYNRSYVEAGSSGQTWQRKTDVADYTGNGYLETDSTDATLGAGGRAVFLNQDVKEFDRKLWIRCRAANAGDSFAIASRGNGSTGTVVAPSTDWTWVESAELWSSNDQSIDVYGIHGEVAIDKFLAQHPDDTTIPTGKDGLVQA